MANIFFILTTLSLPETNSGFGAQKPKTEVRANVIGPDTELETEKKLSRIIRSNVY